MDGAQCVLFGSGTDAAAIIVISVIIANVEVEVVAVIEVVE